MVRGGKTNYIIDTHRFYWLVAAVTITREMHP